ncbi:MAG: FtsX-like permease family protein [Cytophagales bacterium]|nr:FtsX-like permease family protein [Cytophagales bacterium]
MKKRPTPPRLASWWLRQYCSEDLVEEIQGDLLEAYYFRLNIHGKLQADLRYFRDVLQFFKPYSFEKHSRSKQFIPMFSNYLKISIRNIFKHKSFTAINLIGLSLGITSVVLIALHIQHELSYDRSFPDSENIYRLVNEYRDQTYTCMNFDDYYGSDSDTQLRLSDHIRKYDGVEEACHFVPNLSAIGPNRQWYLRANQKEMVMDQLLFTNTGHAFQSIFPQQFLKGSPADAYGDYQTVVLTADVAKRIYGTDWSLKHLIGQFIEIGQESFEIGGVVANPVANTHFNFDMIIHQQNIPSWGAYTYFKTSPATSGNAILAQVNQDIETVYPGYTADVLSKGVKLVSLHDIHFTDNMLYEIKPIANKQYLATFGLIGVVILLIIWTNYANLSVALYTGRQKELAIRKVMGARSKDVSLQVTFEAFLLALMCFPFIIVLLYVTLPYANKLLGIAIAESLIFEAPTLFGITGLLLVTGIISGLYPAVVYSHRSVQAMVTSKLNTKKSRGALQFRNVLLTAQFFMLIGLMSLSMIIMKQMQYVQHKQLGFNSEGVVYFDINDANKFQLLKTELKQMPAVAAIGKGMIPGQDMYNQLTYKMRNGPTTFSDGTLIETSLGSMQVYGIESRAFERLDTDATIFVINETAAKKLANDLNIKPQELIGQTIITEPEWENEEFGQGVPYVIADIIDDFDYFSLKYASQPLLIGVNNRPDSWTYNMILRVTTDNWPGTLHQLEQAYLKVETENPFNVQFLDDNLQELYANERNAGILTVLLTGICVVLAVMGLIGIVGYFTFTRRKEIGIRKVFGATIQQVFRLIFKEYVMMLIIATLLTLPISIYLGNEWLTVFAYRISPSFGFIGMVSGSVTLLIVLLVVVIQSYHTVNKNPTETLRYE